MLFQGTAKGFYITMAIAAIIIILVVVFTDNYNW